MLKKFTTEQILNYNFHDEEEHYKEGYWAAYYHIDFLGEPELLEEVYKGTPLQIATRLSSREFMDFDMPTIRPKEVMDLTS